MWVLAFNLLSLAGKGNVFELESLRSSTLSNLNKTLDSLLFYLILLVTNLGFSAYITQNYLVYLINIHHLNRAWLITIRPAAPWFSEDIKLERRIRRRLERKWRRSGLPEDRIRFIEQNRIVNQLLFSARSQYYTKLIDENCLNQRKLFGVVSNLLQRNPAPLYPSCFSMADLANYFIDFFIITDKITSIRHERHVKTSQQYL